MPLATIFDILHRGICRLPRFLKLPVFAFLSGRFSARDRGQGPAAISSKPERLGWPLDYLAPGSLNSETRLLLMA